MSQLTDLKTYVETAHLETAAPTKSVKKTAETIKRKALKQSPAINTGTSPAYRTIKGDPQVLAFVRKLGFRFATNDISNAKIGSLAMELLPLSKKAPTAKQMTAKSRQFDTFLKKYVSPALRCEPASVNIAGKEYAILLASYSLDDLRVANRLWVDRVFSTLEKIKK